jgi:hypothetical protein
MCKILIYLLALVFVLSVGVNTSARLMGHWKFDESSGKTASDSIAGNDGTLQGIPKWVVGQLGNALEFDGDDWVDCGDILHITDAITIACWINPARFDGFKVYACVSRSDAYELRTTRSRLAWRTPGVAVYIPWKITLLIGEWQHVAVTFVPDQTDGLIFYLDGIEGQRMDTLPSLTGYFPYGETPPWPEHVGPFVIGRGPGTTDVNTFSYEGIIDDVRVYHGILTETEVLAVFEDRSGYPPAYGPHPEDGALYEDIKVTLSWRPGPYAVSHDVYLGDNFDNVDNGTVETFRGNQPGLSYVAGSPGFAYPDGLESGATYYWRVDEVNEANPNSPWKGDVWSFSIPPKTAYHPDPADGAGSVGPDNVTLSWTGGFGAKQHTVYFSDDFDTVTNEVGGFPLGEVAYSPGQLELEKVYYWRVDEFDGSETHKGDVWSFTTPGAVGGPQPSYGATDVEMNAILSWTPSDRAASHKLYVGTDRDAVRNADTSAPEYEGSMRLGAESYDPGLLDAETIYYWRVDEVDDQGNTAKGPLWTFTTASFLLIDDFEGYTDDKGAGEAIWQTWIDGLYVRDNGSQVGYLDPPYVEQTIVHGGSKSMPIFYVNEAGVRNSEAWMRLTAPRDWTIGAVAELSLWLGGDSANATEPLYVAISNAAGAPAIVAYDDKAIAARSRWTEWRIPLQAFVEQGVDLTDVDKIAIGLGSKGGAAAGGTGTIYIDDIRLYQP